MSSSQKIDVLLKETRIEDSGEEFRGIRLRKFQKELYDILHEKNSIVTFLKAPTGSGKTFTLVLSLFESTITSAIYPSKALLRDQMSSVIGILEKIGFKREKEGDNGVTVMSDGKTKVELIELTSDTAKDAWDVLRTSPQGKRVVFTVPEYPYMLLTIMKKTNVISELMELVMTYNTLDDMVNNSNIRENDIREPLIYYTFTFDGNWFIDEYHLYEGLSRNSLNSLVLMYIIHEARRDRKLIFSSATPIDLDRGVFEKFGFSVRTVEAKYTKNGQRIRKPTLLHFNIIPGKFSQIQDKMLELVINDRGNIESRLKNDIKVGIIFDRVYYLAKLCREFNEFSPAVVWGLDYTPQGCIKSGNLKQEKFIIGNHAVSFGIDIAGLDYGHIYATTANIAIQRLGRFGRSGDNETEVNIYVSTKALNGLKKDEYEYEEFINILPDIYPKEVEEKLDKTDLGKAKEIVSIMSYILAQTLEVKDQRLPKMKRVLSQLDPLKKIDLGIKLISSDDYYRVFSFRNSSITKIMCSSKESEDFFVLLRNFKYDTINDCFDNTPIKEYPHASKDPRIRKSGKLKCALYTYSELKKVVGGEMYLNLPGQKKYREFSKLFDSHQFIYVVTRDCIKDVDFSEWAKLVSARTSSLPLCSDDECSHVEALLLFM